MSGSIFARTLRLVVWTMFLAVGLSCSKRVTQIVVRIEADPQIYQPDANSPELLQSVRVTVSREGASSAFHDASYRVNAAADGDAGLVNLPGSLTILPRDPEDVRPVTIEVTGEMGSGRGRITQTWLLAFQPEATLFIRFTLSGSCVERNCGSQSTCEFGRCLRQDQPSYVGPTEPPAPHWQDAGGMDVIVERDVRDEDMVTPPRPDVPPDIIDAGLDSEVMDVRDMADEMEVHDDDDRPDIREASIPIEERVLPIDVIDADVVDVDVINEFDAHDVRDVVEDDSPVDLQTPDACDTGLTPCPGGCFNTSASLLHCSGCNRACAPPNAIPRCGAGICQIENCLSGFANCNFMHEDGCEVRLASAPTNCGMCGMRCPVPVNGDATCTNGECGFACHPGYIPFGGGCGLEVPRPIAPMSTVYVSTRRPTLRWVAAAGSTGTRVQICEDRDCTRPEWMSDVTSPSTSVAPASDLPAGVHFWRLFGLRGTSVTSASPVWQFMSPRTSTSDTSWGAIPDVNGDGYSDVIIRATTMGGDAGLWVGRLYVYYGSRSGVPSVPDRTLSGPEGPDLFGHPVVAVGDLNGDGFGDIATASFQGQFNRVYIYYGARMGVSAAPSIVEPDPSDTMNRAFNLGHGLAAGGDLNGDGFGDLLATATCLSSPTGPCDRSMVRVLYGGPSGVAWRSGVSIYSMSMIENSVLGACDLTGDGVSDLAIRDTGTVYPGGPSGVTMTRSTSVSFMGSRLECLGDVDNDGYHDLATFGRNLRANGTAYAYRGSSGGVLVGTPVLTFADPEARGEVADDVTAAGDIDGDGFNDVVVGLPNGEGRVGRVYTYHGWMSFPPRLGNTISSPTPMVQSEFGRKVSGVGDIDRDGFCDFIVGAYAADMGPRYTRGAAYVYFGSPTIRDGGVGRMTILANPDTLTGANFGSELASTDFFDDLSWETLASVFPVAATMRIGIHPELSGAPYSQR